MEKYIVFKLVKKDCPIILIFTDALQFPPSSLGKLVQSKEQDQFSILRENFLPTSKFDLLLRKGVYPSAT